MHKQLYVLLKLLRHVSLLDEVRKSRAALSIGSEALEQTHVMKSAHRYFFVLPKPVIKMNVNKYNGTIELLVLESAYFNCNFMCLFKRFLFAAGSPTKRIINLLHSFLGSAQLSGSLKVQELQTSETQK